VRSSRKKSSFHLNYISHDSIFGKIIPSMNGGRK
jgi:hypothetical protein